MWISRIAIIEIIGALLEVHGWGHYGGMGSGGGMNRTWPKSISVWMQDLQELDALVKKEDLQS